MKFTELATTVRDAISVRRVFADPIERDGVVLVPAAVVSGGAGGGNGQDEKGQEGEGGGFGVGARPVGAYLINGDRVGWLPAVDVNRLVMTVGVVAIAYLVTRAQIVRARAKVLRSAD
ncbi:spore germination protein GerW family protein [Amycolatopsis sp. GM8]|uniref:spore germination protein GerW family protein n=1 Tax=Amycolatopsis sp. GM8 TaxID=2896530 RepID=UPI001F2F7F76|nr:spore germination protein GerW family protein [Amycolatopsis sp. GM8]